MRAESVDGQLNGTIPPTSDNQGERFNHSDRQNDALETFNPFDGSAPPDMPNRNTTNNDAAFLLLGISTVVLLAGMVTALLFQRRRPVKHHQ